jgi:plastocyanin
MRTASRTGIMAVGALVLASCSSEVDRTGAFLGVGGAGCPGQEETTDATGEGGAGGAPIASMTRRTPVARYYQRGQAVPRAEAAALGDIGGPFPSRNSTSSVTSGVTSGVTTGSGVGPNPTRPPVILPEIPTRPGSGGENPIMPAPTTAPPPPLAAATIVACGAAPEVRIMMNVTGFEPADVAVALHATVAFANDTPIPHESSSGTVDRLEAAPDGNWSTGEIADGESVCVRFGQPGTYPYYDPEFLGSMTGAITVQ